MSRYKFIIILTNLIILLFVFNNSVVNEESLLEKGKLILLELKPVDPRSLMQGDYMSLDYAIADNINNDNIAKNGFCIVMLQENDVAKRIRLQEQKTPLLNDEYAIKYTSKSYYGINIVAESYFFQEGEAEKYSKAKYGGIKIDTDGNSLLVGLYNKDYELIE